VAFFSNFNFLKIKKKRLASFPQYLSIFNHEHTTNELEVEDWAVIWAGGWRLGSYLSWRLKIGLLFELEVEDWAVIW